jgi:hypothetical protein
VAAAPEDLVEAACLWFLEIQLCYTQGIICCPTPEPPAPAHLTGSQLVLRHLRQQPLLRLDGPQPCAMQPELYWTLLTQQEIRQVMAAAAAHDRAGLQAACLSFKQVRTSTLWG